MVLVHMKPSPPSNFDRWRIFNSNYASEDLIYVKALVGALVKVLEYRTEAGQEIDFDLDPGMSLEVMAFLSVVTFLRFNYHVIYE